MQTNNLSLDQTELLRREMNNLAQEAGIGAQQLEEYVFESL